MLRCIQKHTINHGKKDNDDFDLHVDELESFTDLQIARGVLVGKNTVKQLWSKEWGQPIFRNTMSHDRYQEIMKHLRFDDFFSWRQRRETDKFCLISEVWNCFIENCKKCYAPNFDLTIDEQLFPCKTRCPFYDNIWLTSQTNLELSSGFWLMLNQNTCAMENHIYEETLFEADVATFQVMCVLDPFTTLLKKSYTVTTDKPLYQPKASGRT